VSRATFGRKTTINLLYDLFPEALIQAGIVRPDSWLAGRCADITRYSLRECDVTVFLGEHLRAYVEATYGSARRAVIIPVGADGSLFSDFPPRGTLSQAKPRILYCGQMGRMHEVETLLAAWDSGEAAALEWVFHSGGAGYRRLRAKAKDRSGVVWGAGLSDAEWVDAMKQAEVALVTIARGAEMVVMPSKTYSALVAGQAILAICPMKSDLAALVQKHDCGWVVEPGDVGAFRGVLTEILERPEILLRKRTNAFEAGHTHYDMTVIAERWMELFTELSSSQSSSQNNSIRR
jgi:glycosyltransferase involved in cell wall biosynthesis